ncbi:MAG: DUF4886 domain-containing protein, partial [Clostridia bacterium]|nr:DUF4886 domain-containing protein [Clostridia bacterium]
PDVEFAWHMTWAYKNDYQSNPYGGQDEMYNAIVSAVQNKIVPNKSITKIIPNGTAIQNARTSYLGDSFTRDNSHLTFDTGRTIAALTTVEALIGIDWTTFDMESLYFLAPNAGKGFPRLAVESTRNAIQKPFEVTQSAF